MKNVLNDKQHLLNKLGEECGEVVQELFKGHVFGLDNEYKDQTVKERLETEIGHVLGVIDLLTVGQHLDGGRIADARIAKPAKMQHWYEYILEKNDVGKPTCDCGGSRYDLKC